MTSVRFGKPTNIRSLKSLILFGLRGMAAYAYHALMLGRSSEEVDAFFLKGLAALGDFHLPFALGARRDRVLRIQVPIRDRDYRPHGGQLLDTVSYALLDQDLEKNVLDPGQRFEVFHEDDQLASLREQAASDLEYDFMERHSSQRLVQAEQLADRLVHDHVFVKEAGNCPQPLSIPAQQVPGVVGIRLESRLGNVYRVGKEQVVWYEILYRLLVLDLVLSGDGRWTNR